jgi:hypothetical protein
MSDVFPPVPNPANMHGQNQPGLGDEKSTFDLVSFSQANFNFTSGQNGWNGLGNVNNSGPPLDPFGAAVPVLPDFNVDPSIPTPSGEMGFDWINWLSTASVTMMAPEEPGMGSM